MNNGIREYIYSKFGEEGFATKEENGVPAMAQNKRKFVTFYILRETIAPLIDRSDDPETSISFIMHSDDDNEKEVIEVPARKFKSKEKLMGLKLCRSFNVIDPGYEYNSVRSISYLSNPNSVIFGDSVVEGGDAGQAMLPSRVLYSSSYSIRSRSEITKQLTHNSLSEAGTMWDRESGSNRTSLFNTEYIIPGVFFPSFVTLLNPTPESLIHMLLCFKQRSYGAQTSITGPNVKNNIVAIVTGEEELPVTSYTISEGTQLIDNFGESMTGLRENINKYVIEALKKESPSKLIMGIELDQFLDTVDKLSPDELKGIYEKLKADSVELVKYAKILRDNKKKKQPDKKSGINATLVDDESDESL
ncbi:MAG: type I-D CRISPR-associated protein Cas7/Csc2 [Cuniculiplasma sp.]